MKLGIVGIGLIGSSLARAFSQTPSYERLYVFDNNADYLRELPGLGLNCEQCVTLTELAQRSDIIFVCTPVSSIGALISELIPLVSPSTVITDVGSVKQPIVDLVRTIHPNFQNFVPGHPIAGGHNSGPAFGKSELFRDKTYLLTPYSQTSPESVSIVKNLLEAIGAKISVIDADAHDKILAYISHVPHVYAFALINASRPLSCEVGVDVLDYAGASFNEISRFAAADTKMWLDIFDVNGPEILKVLEIVEHEIANLADAIRSRDLNKIRNLISSARTLRISMSKEKTNVH